MFPGRSITNDQNIRMVLQIASICYFCFVLRINQSGSLKTLNCSSPCTSTDQYIAFKVLDARNIWEFNLYSKANTENKNCTEKIIVFILLSYTTFCFVVVVIFLYNSTHHHNHTTHHMQMYLRGNNSDLK